MGRSVRRRRCGAIVSAVALATSLSGASASEAVHLAPDVEHPVRELASRVLTAISPVEDEFVILYHRPDGDYARWNLWIWSSTAAGRRVEFTGVKDGVAYLRGRIADYADPAEPLVHFIVRTDAWEKDPGIDQSWNFAAGKACVVVSGEPKVLAIGVHEARIVAARPLETAPGRFAVRVTLSRGLIVPAGAAAGFSLGRGIRIAREESRSGGEEFLLHVEGDVAGRACRVTHRLFAGEARVRFPSEPPPVRPLTPAVRSKLPEPVLDGHKEWIDLYWAAWAFMKEKITRGDTKLGFVPRYIDEGFNENIYQWDSCFMALYAMYGTKFFPAMAALDNFYNLQRKSDGYICRTYNENTGKATGENDINPPLFAWVEWRYSRLTGDTSRLERVLPALDAYFEWCMRNARGERSNGLYYITDLGSGMDNSPRERFIGRGAWVDVSSQQAHAALAIARLAALAGRKDLEAKYSALHAELAGRIDEYLWSEERGNYFDRAEDGSLHVRRTIASFWPMVAEVADEGKARRMIGNYLKNPDRFYRRHLFPTLSADDPEYDGRGLYWRGGVWAPTNYATIKGLERFDGAFAHEAAMNHIEAMSRVYHDFDPESYACAMPTLTEENISRNGDGRRQIWESYSPDNDAPGTRWDGTLLVRQRFCGWSGIGPVALLVENVLGFDADGLTRTLTWRIRLTERHGVKRLRFGGNEVTLIASAREKGRPFTVTGRAAKRVRLVIYVDDDPTPRYDAQIPRGAVKVRVRSR